MKIISMKNIVAVFSLLLNISNGLIGQRECKEAQSCLGLSFSTNYTTLTCDGYESCADLVSTEVDTSINCYGVRSCAKIQNPYLRAGTVTCNGYESCSGSKIIADGNTYCYGDRSCANSTVFVESDSDETQSVSYNIVECRGSLSCAMSTFTPQVDSTTTVAATLKGYGPYSFYQTVINSTNSPLNLDMYGYYAGYNTTVYCGSSSDDACDVTCYGTGCYNMAVICLSEGNCNIDCNETAGISCPLNVTYNSNDRANDYTIDYSSLYNISISPSKFLHLTDEGNNCLDSTSNNRIDCNDYHSCYNESYVDNNNRSICCQATESCEIATFSTSTQGYSNSQNQINALVRCDGDSSCELTTLVVNNTVDCGGYHSCQGAQLDTASSVRCDAYYSCLSSSIADASDLFCNADRSCYSAQISRVSNIYSLGYRALDGATVYSPKTGDTVNMYFCGYYSGYDVSICCYSEDTCNVYCADEDACTGVKSATDASCDGNHTLIYDYKVSDNACQVYMAPPTASPTMSPTNVSMAMSSTESMEMASSTMSATNEVSVNNTMMNTMSNTMSNTNTVSGMGTTETWENINMSSIYGSTETTSGSDDTTGKTSNKNNTNSTLGTVAIVVASLVGVAIIGLGVFYCMRKRKNAGAGGDEHYNLLNNNQPNNSNL